MEDKSLLLIDGMGLIYRAFYGIQGLSTADGQPTNALYGFIRLVGQLKDIWSPSHWVVVFDGGLPEARTSVLETYKAQRDPMPDALACQLELIDEYLEAARIPWVMMEGEEADDVMATLAHRAAAMHVPVYIATSDKDLYQVVSDTVTVVSPSKKGGHMGPAEVEAKTGVPPEMMVEWQALVGDTADNVPGVPGVGPKTAAKWLKEYGSLAGILSHVTELKPDRFRTVLPEQEENVRRNLQVVRMRTDLDCAPDWDGYVVSDPDTGALLAFLDKYELESMAKALRDND